MCNSAGRGDFFPDFALRFPPLASFLGGRLAVTKNLIDLDLPLLVVISIVFLAAAPDRMIGTGEAIYSSWFFSSSMMRTRGRIPETSPPWRTFLVQDIAILTADFIGLVVGANFLIEAVLRLSGILGMWTGVISLVAVAIGTSYFAVT